MKIRARIGFPTACLAVLTPVPITDEDALVLPFNGGVIRFFFDEYDIGRNRADEQVPERVDSVLLTVEPSSEVPALAALGKETPDNIALSDWANSVENLEGWAEAGRSGWTGEADKRWHKIREDLAERATRAAQQYFENAGNRAQLEPLAETLNATISRLLEFLRIHYAQYEIGDPPRYLWSHVSIQTDGGARRELSWEFIDEWLNKRSRQRGSGFSQPLSLDSWPKLVELVTSNEKPDLDTILLANARSECDPNLGNPRLALIEAVTALEIVIKRKMSEVLGAHGVSKTAIDRIVRETPTADLMSVWLRPYVPSEYYPVLEKCAEATRERNELIHHERRAVSFVRAQEFVSAIASARAVVAGASKGV